MIPSDVGPNLRVMLYPDDTFPPNAGPFTGVHLEGLVTVLMAAGANGVLGSVTAETVGSWGEVDADLVWRTAAANSLREEQATVRSLAPQGSPDLFAVMSTNRISGTLLSVLQVPELVGRLGCIVSYPHKDMFIAHRLDAPDRFDLGRLLHMTERIGEMPPETPSVPMWLADEHGFERLDVIKAEPRLRLKAGPRLRAALQG